VKRASQVLRAQLTNAALGLLKAGSSTTAAAASLADAHGLSVRQARRYVAAAQRLSAAVPVPDRKIVFTVKLPEGLANELRELARRRGDTLSALVGQALRSFLRGKRRRG
jgi:predicted DNA-binding transcriptional regulator YafY